MNSKSGNKRCNTETWILQTQGSQNQSSDQGLASETDCGDSIIDEKYTTYVEI